MRKLLAVLVVTVLASGCATVGAMMQPTDHPGIYVSDETAAGWGCKGEYVRLAAADYAKKLDTGRTYMPQVGWTACDLLAHVGEPREIDLQQSAAGRSASLWYGSPHDPRLVTVVYDQTNLDWVVDYVGW